MRTMPSAGSPAATSSKRIVSGGPSSRTTQAFIRWKATAEALAGARGPDCHVSGLDSARFAQNPRFDARHSARIDQTGPNLMTAEHAATGAGHNLIEPA